MARYPGAAWLPIERNHGGRRTRTRAVVLHVDAGAAKSLRGWFNKPAALASSHFYVTFDGRVEQYLDTDVVAWTQRDGNSSCVGIETQGKGDGEWTPAQLAALAQLLVWLCDLYGLPRADMRNSLPSSRGIGLHRYGIDPWRVPGGETWGPNGKVCPGEGRVRQFPTLIARLAGANSQEDDMTQADVEYMRGALDALTSYVLHGRGKDADDRVLGFLQQRRVDGQLTRAADNADLGFAFAQLAGQNAGLQTALTQIEAGNGVDLDAIRQATEQGVADALAAVETTVTVKKG